MEQENFSVFQLLNFLRVQNSDGLSFSNQTTTFACKISHWDGVCEIFVCYMPLIRNREREKKKAIIWQQKMKLLKAGFQTEESTIHSYLYKKSMHWTHIDRRSRKIYISVSAKPFSFIFLTLCREKLIEGSAVLCIREEFKYHKLFNHVHTCFSGGSWWTSHGYKIAEKELPKHLRNHIKFRN